MTARVGFLIISGVLAGLVTGHIPSAPARVSLRPLVVVVMSSHALPYQEALNGFSRTLKQRSEPVDIEVVSAESVSPEVGLAEAASTVAPSVEVTSTVAPSADTPQNTASSFWSGLSGRDARVIVTLGTQATRAALGWDPQVPLVGGMLLDVDAMKNRNATGVLLQIPIETHLEWLKVILPKARRVGVLYHPAQNQQFIEKLTQLAPAYSLEIVARQVGQPSQIPSALESLASRADVLLGIADQVVLTPQTGKEILLFSFRQRIPFVGLSSAWTKAGALYTLEWDYDEVGHLVAEIVDDVLSGKPIAEIDPIVPDKMQLVLNKRTAAHMRIDIPNALYQKANLVYE